MKSCFLAALTAAAFCCSPLMAAEGTPFQIDQSQQRLSNEAMASLQEQLKVIESVGLPPQVLAAMKRTVVVVDPDLRDGQLGAFAVRRGVGAVRVRPMVFEADRPVLLHEFLHAYHVNVLGRDRPEIRQAYTQVMASNVFPPLFRSAHFLENEKEFFAVTAVIYLFGDIRQPPFRCAALARLDAAYLAFLGAQFGPGVCGMGRAQVPGSADAGDPGAGALSE
ncbi:hypothetical protein G4G28_17615 [Massilia sp. Dwa41.01b]|uniref:hypothetical protein n=2 Tax=unclassified Massilia TaxID=2609279 RepID=UPI0015FF2DA7|nr:hypothetical protein [Massilia sp. Dwa41.01b]QNA89853.1 hypothetical protein G4G28_17615 [Massilia sp. Dwa41.01b]